MGTPQPMKTLLILRHAKSSWNDPGVSDHDRPLNSRGKEEAPQVGLELRRRSTVPDLVLSSTAKRARKTAKKVLAAGEFACELTLLPELYLASPGTWLTVLQSQANHVRTLLVVGHNPGLEELVTALTGQHVAMCTAALAEIQLPIEQWTELAAPAEYSLASVWRP